jgi:hypothetical protein
MKTIKKLLLIPLILFSGIVIGYAQPAFTIAWISNCEVQSTNFIYKLEFKLVYVPDQTTIYQSPAEGIIKYPSDPQEHVVVVSNFNCDKDDLATDYRIFASVVRIEDGGLGDISCSGELRTSGLRCAQLYDDLTFTVLMYYP